MKKLRKKSFPEHTLHLIQNISEAAKGEQKRFGGGTKQINDSRSKRSREKEVGTDTPPADKAGDKPGEREDRRERRSAAAVSAAPEADREDNKVRSATIIIIY